MAKSTFFTGQPVFNQLLQFIPRSMVHRIAKKHSGDRYCKKFSSYDHLVTMLYAALHRCSSLRDQLWSALIADLLLKIVKDKVDQRRT